MELKDRIDSDEKLEKFKRNPFNGIERERALHQAVDEIASESIQWN